MLSSTRPLSLLLCAAFSFGPLQAADREVRDEYAKVLIALKDYDAAIEVYDDLIADPEFIFDEQEYQSLLLNRARALDWAGRDLEAIEAYLQLDEKSTEVRRGLANCYMALHSWHKAQVIYEELYAKDPNDQELLVLIGNCLRLQGELVAAEAIYSQADTLPGALFGLAAIAEASFRPKKALEAYRQLRTLDPSQSSELAYIRALGQCGRFFEAHAALDTLGDDSNQAKLLRARLYSWASCLQRSLYELEGIEGLQAAVLKERATIYKRSGQMERADELLAGLERGLPEAPSGSDRYQEARNKMRDADAALGNGDLVSGTKFIEEAAALLTGSTPLKLRLVEAYTAQGRFDEAYDLVRQVIESEPLHEGARLLLAQNRAWSLHYEEAYEAYGLLIEMDPLHSAARLELARALCWNNEHDRGFREYRQLQEKDTAYTLLASLEQEGKEQVHKHHPLAARDAYLRLIEEDPSNLEARFDLAQVYSSIGEHQRALHSYRDILDKAPLHRAALTVYEASKRCQSPSIQASLLYRREIGRDELQNMRLWRPALRVTQPVGAFCPSTFWAELAYSNYKASGRTEDLLQVGAGIDWKPSIRSQLSGFTFLNDYSGRLDTTLTGDCALHYDLGQCSTVSIGVSQEDILSNHYNFDRHIYTRSIYVDLFTWLSQRNSLAARYAKEDYSDDNCGDVVFLSLAHAFCEGPRLLSLHCDVFIKNVDNNSPQYWTPNWYRELIVSLEWEHHPSEEYFAEYDPFWYRLRVGGGMDGDYTEIFRGRAEVYRDYGNAWQLQGHLEGSYSDTYRLIEIGVALVCFF